MPTAPNPLSTSLFPLPQGIRSRRVPDVNGLTMHVLEAGHPTVSDPAPRPVLLLLHGFPELAYSWRKVMLPLAQAGFHVIAPDQRGYGGTTGWRKDYDAPIMPFHLLNLVRDMLALLAALGLTEVHAVIGHDFGAPVAGWCGLTRPDVFKSVALMSAPFTGSPALPMRKDVDVPMPSAFSITEGVMQALAQLNPPRKHYQWYYATRHADKDMRTCPEGLAAFLRAYYHVKSADWPDNAPHALPAFSADALAVLPDYYVMPQDATMPEAVRPHCPDPEQVQRLAWLSDDELNVYARTFEATGFQGGLNWYRCGTDASCVAWLQLFAGQTLNVPTCFIAGASDWGVHQTPGAFMKMQSTVCSNLTGVHLIDGAGHWVQQEQPGQVLHHLLAFLSR